VNPGPEVRISSSQFHSPPLLLPLPLHSQHLVLVTLATTGRCCPTGIARRQSVDNFIVVIFCTEHTSTNLVVCSGSNLSLPAKVRVILMSALIVVKSI
jgi:hypothetical protein